MINLLRVLSHIPILPDPLTKAKFEFYSNNVSYKFKQHLNFYIFDFHDRELLKECFRHIYAYVLLGKRYQAFNEESLRYEVSKSLKYYFKLKLAEEAWNWYHTFLIIVIMIGPINKLNKVEYSTLLKLPYKDNY